MRIPESLLLVSLLALTAGYSLAADAPIKDAGTWRLGTPIVTYFAGPPMTEQVAAQMAAGGFNVVWCTEKDLDLVHRHGLRGMVHDGLLSPASLDTPAQMQQFDGLIDRIRKHPAL